MTKELFYGQTGSVLYEDTDVGWYPAPYETLPTRGALASQIYLTDAPVNDLEVVRLSDLMRFWERYFLLMGA
ncbi:MAG: hypothetical protein QMD92_00250 [bacterium]|nr:hypothetical protein [bacterium]